MIIGISGTFNAGKDVAADYLVNVHGFTHISTSDIVRQVAQEKYGSIERNVLRKTADETRAQSGAGYFVERSVEAARAESAEGGIVLTGIRSIGEYDSLKKQGGILVFIDAPIELRYERSQKRARTGDEQTFTEFMANEEVELLGKGEDKTVINLNALKELADRYVINDQDLGSYLAAIEQIYIDQSAAN